MEVINAKCAWQLLEIIIPTSCELNYLCISTADTTRENMVTCSELGGVAEPWTGLILKQTATSAKFEVTQRVNHPRSVKSPTGSQKSMDLLKFNFVDLSDGFQLSGPCHSPMLLKRCHICELRHVAFCRKHRFIQACGPMSRDNRYVLKRKQCLISGFQSREQLIRAHTHFHREFYWPKVSVRIKCKGGEER